MQLLAGSQERPWLTWFPPLSSSCEWSHGQKAGDKDTSAKKTSKVRGDRTSKILKTDFKARSLLETSTWCTWVPASGATHPSALILVPSMELGLQVALVAQQLAKALAALGFLGDDGDVSFFHTVSEGFYAEP